ncbi:CheR family methyltransferase, partial [Nostoc sp. NIES-2111]
TPAQIEPIPASLRSRFLRRSKAGDRFRLHPLLREAISFHRLNLMDPSYPIADTFDAIFCRNVMIYFDRPTQEQVLRKLLQFLRPSGYLFIGHSESANGFSLPARSVGASILQKAG